MNGRLWTPEIVRPPMPVVDGALRRLRQKEYDRWKRVRDRLRYRMADPVLAQAVVSEYTTDLVLAYGSANTAGNLLIAVVTYSASDHAGSIPDSSQMSVSDSLGNSWTRVAPFDQMPNSLDASTGILIYYCANCKGGSNTVTWANGTVGNPNQQPSDHGVSLYEYANIATVSPLDTGSPFNTVATGNTATTTPTSGNITSTQRGLIFVVFADETVAQSSMSAGGSFSLLHADGGHIDIEEALVADAGTYTASLTLGLATKNWEMQALCFKGVGGGPTVAQEMGGIASSGGDMVGQMFNAFCSQIPA